MTIDNIHGEVVRYVPNFLSVKFDERQQFPDGRWAHGGFIMPDTNGAPERFKVGDRVTVSATLVGGGCQVVSICKE